MRTTRDTPTYRYVGADAKTLDGGWESLGDMGWFDDDGYLYLGDRVQDMILSRRREHLPGRGRSGDQRTSGRPVVRRDRAARRGSRQRRPRHRARPTNRSISQPNCSSSWASDSRSTSCRAPSSTSTSRCVTTRARSAAPSCAPRDSDPIRHDPSATEPIRKPPRETPMSDASTAVPAIGRQIRSLITTDGELELSLVDVDVPTPTDDQVLVRIEAAPINPSDLGLLFGGADMSAATVDGDARPTGRHRTDRAGGAAAMTGRVGESMAVGNEGGGVVVAAGSSPAAQALLGRTVGVLGGSTYSAVPVRPRVAGAGPARRRDIRTEGAACFVNPLTALGMVGTMRARGTHGVGPHRGRLQPRPDAQPAVSRRLDRARQRRAPRPSRRSCCATRARRTSATRRRRRSSTTSPTR